jgi:hypothetical protein
MPHEASCPGNEEGARFRAASAIAEAAAAAPSGYTAPVRTHSVRIAICPSESLVFGGIRSPSSGWRMARTSGLASGLPGTTTGPPWRSAAAVSSSSPPRAFPFAREWQP